MIQRIQTLYISLVAIFSVIVYTSVAVWQAEEIKIYASEASYLPLLFGLIIGIAVATVLQYKRRKRQFVSNRLNILLNLIALVLILLPAYTSMNPVGLEHLPVQVANGGVLPLVNIVLLVFANRGIRRDEELIKDSSDEFKNAIIQTDYCNGSGRKDYLVNTDKHNRYNVTVRISVTQSGRTRTRNKVFRMNASSKKFLGCTTSGSIPTADYSRAVIGEEEL